MTTDKRIEELTFEVTHKCNLKCIHCSSRCINGQLTLYEIEDFIDKYNPKSIRWSGGEPFIYLSNKYLNLEKETVKHIVTTNGTFINKTLKLINEIDELRISVYGNKEFHNGICGRKTYDTIIKLIETLKDEGQYHIILTSPYFNYEQSKNVINLAVEYNLRYRITALVPNLDIENKFIGNTCSTGKSECMYHKKVLVLPNGEVVRCAVDKRGFICKYKNDVV